MREYKWLTFETIRNVDFELNVTEKHGQRHGEVGFSAEGDVAISSLQSVERQDTLAQQLATLIVHTKPQHCQVGQYNLLTDKGL